MSRYWNDFKAIDISEDELYSSDKKPRANDKTYYF